MLHIKLPKKLVSQACVYAIERATDQIAVIEDRYLLKMKRRQEKIDQNDIGAPIPCEPSVYSTSIERLDEDREKLREMAHMCKHSIGDVYVDSELWNLIRREINDV